MKDPLGLDTGAIGVGFSVQWSPFSVGVNVDLVSDDQRNYSVSGNTFNADNGMSAFNGATLSYDANGNLTSEGTNTYSGDARNHLTAISGGTTASFTYDAFGREQNYRGDGYSVSIRYSEPRAGNPSGSKRQSVDGARLDEYFARTDSGRRNRLASARGLCFRPRRCSIRYSLVV